MSIKRPFKIVIAGEKRVGKSSLVHRFVYEQFPLKGLYSTVGFDFTLKTITLEDNSTVVVHIYDFGGEPRFQKVFPQYAVDCDGLILAFDPSREETLDQLHEWIKVYGRDTESINFIVSTKSDLGISIDPIKINDLRNKYKIDEYYQTSAVSGENTEEVFQRLALVILQKQTENETTK